MHQEPDNIDLDKASGLIFGLAIGDAIGYPTEFMSLNQIKAKFGPNGMQDLTMVS
jgi:ADP-ribosylglycohydrolase